MQKSSEVILPEVPYFQVVFTLPDKLSALILGNRSQLYSLLFRSAWKALDAQLRSTGKFQPAALMVLHTWNQQLQHHTHIHALVPGAGPSIDGGSWVVAKHPRHRRRKKAYLTDNVELSRAFRKFYLRGLTRLRSKHRLCIGGSVEHLNDPRAWAAFLKELESVDWNVFVQGPPHGKSEPASVMKYLAGYLTGGPISDRRVLSADNQEVWISARPKRTSKSSRRKGAMAKPRPYRLSAREFMRRWSLHVLPKGFTRSRSYGGYHPRKRKQYLASCRSLGTLVPNDTLPPSPETEPPETEPQPRKCRHCENPLELISFQRRPSWKFVFERGVYQSGVYAPVHHLCTGRSPPARCD